LNADNRCHFFSTDPENSTLLEKSLPRFLHLLAHHPDFGTEVDDLKGFAPYIEFFLDAIAMTDNVSFLYSMAVQLKGYEDVKGGDSKVC
jgi:sister chromatid cohesion protein PDS5